MFLKTLAFTTLLTYLFKIGFSIYFSFAIVDANDFLKEASGRHQLLMETNYQLIETYSRLTSLEYLKSQPSFTTLTPVKRYLNLHL